MSSPESPVSAAPALPAAGAGSIVDYLTEQKRQQHIARDVLLRQQLQLRHEHVEGWRAETVAREIRDAETVERWLDRAIRGLGVRS